MQGFVEDAFQHFRQGGVFFGIAVHGGHNVEIAGLKGRLDAGGKGNGASGQFKMHLLFWDETPLFSEVLDMLADAAKHSSAVYVCPSEHYEPFTRLIKDVKDAEKIRDSSLAMLRLLEVAAEWLESLKTEPEKQEVAS